MLIITVTELCVSINVSILALTDKGASLIYLTSTVKVMLSVSLALLLSVTLTITKISP